MAHDPIKCVEQVPIFRGAPKNVIEALARVSVHQKKIPAGQMIYSSGEPNDRLMIVDSGRVRVFSYADDDHERTLYMLHSSDVDLTGALFSSHEHHNFAQAIEPTEICYLKQSAFKDVLKSYPEMALSLVDILGERLTLLEQRDVTDTLLTSKERLYNYLLELQGQFNSPTYKLPVTKRELALYLGITPETLSRQLKLLVKENKIKVDRREFTIL
ncbi:Crp/Fnr family transcriptional regulator [Companilactobacillus nodensis]|uniref:FNR-like transcriptional regulator n=1 Tax=Companilactobacillus nodensis DSM 19682 = JCM 14932 = NBRC 107160 TaxID=1423775 RepID=A0A0R1K6F2_9LACO|nr:Crp/Fnr family transcriptional regulator [Companilactobacillus nodensis]KRK79190.1 FNR-like transcriptional regulator [Companilactobacillus nodensis DSM 19682 = JCM 14932 = NBRC 107160]